jgi:hypothetical protein
MSRIIVLDTGPAWLLIKPRGHGAGDRARAWLDGLYQAGKSHWNREPA